MEKDMEKDIQKDLDSHSNDSYDSKETGNSRATNHCPHCSITFKNKSSLLIHLFSHDCDNNYRCNVYACWKKFKAHQEYVDHMLIHQEEYPNGCGICSKRFKSRDGFMSHLQTHTMKNKRAPVKMFEQNDEVMDYTGNNTAIGTDNSSPIHVNSAEKFINKTRTFFKCRYCGKSFNYKSSLEFHMDKHENELICKVCNKRFSSVQEHTNHMKQHDIEYDEGFAYGCSICEKSFKYLELLQAHTETHMSANAHRIKYACNRCNNDFTSIEELASHCETCDNNDRIGKVYK